MSSKIILLGISLTGLCLLSLFAKSNGFLPNQSEAVKKGYINIELKRQKSPLEHHLNHGQLVVEHTDLISKKHHKGGGAPRTNDSIALYRYLDNEFYGEIVIGHPGQTLHVAFDTAWTNSWVLSSQCNIWKTAGCWFHRLYDHSGSSEWKKDGRPYIANEGKYNFTGFYSYDNISIAHSNVTAMNFVEMTNVPYSFVFNKIDGVLGLGLQNPQHEPFFYKLLKQKKIKDPIFSIYLNRDKQSSRGGNIMLGFVDNKHIHKTVVNGKPIIDKINYFQVDTSYYWRFQMDNITIGTTEPATLCKNGCKAFVDTSTNSITGPKDEIDDLNNKIKAKEFLLNRYTVDCDKINKLPVINFTIGGHIYSLKGPHYTVQLSWKGLQICLSAFVPGDLTSDQNVWVLGGAFLAEYYTIYNVYDKLLGIVKAAP